MEEEVKKKRKYTKIPDYAKEYMEHRQLLAREVEKTYKETLTEYFKEPCHIISEDIFIYLYRMVKDIYATYIKPNIAMEFICPVDIKLLSDVTYKSFAQETVQYKQFYKFIKEVVETYDNTDRHPDHAGNTLFLHIYYFLTHDTKR